MDYLGLSETSLFHNIPTEDIKVVLSCLQSRRKSFKKEERIFSIGDKIEEVGLILLGSVLIENNDFWGNRSILGIIEKGNTFGESYAWAGKSLKVNVIAAEYTEILFLNTRSLITMCSKGCDFHTQLIQNLLSVSSSNNIRLSQRILNTSSNRIRGRLISYLSQEAHRNSSHEFTIPLNRQELADYLNVDRSALSNELGKMRDEKLLSFHKNKFKLFNMKENTSRD